MATIVLFSREDLVHFFGSLDGFLSKNHRLIHLAYSDKEEKILREEYKILKIINLKKEVSEIYSQTQPDSNLLSKIDQEIIAFSDQRFCLNSSIQSDRTFEYISYEDSLLLAQVYYQFWDQLIKDNNLSYIIHEVCSLYLTHIATVLCKKHGAQYLSPVQVRGEGKFNWIITEGDNGFPIELFTHFERKSLSEESFKRTVTYIENFREKQGQVFPELIKKSTKKENYLFIRFCIQLAKLILRSLKSSFSFQAKKSYNAYDHIEKYFESSPPGFIEKVRNIWDSLFYLKYDDLDLQKDFLYYPMHVEPEAVVLYWADGIYKNQVKLIENIAGQLPPACYLYVKVHPLDKANRPYLDYKRIQAIPNVKLIAPEIASAELTLKSKGLITINGTSGFEAILLNKSVYTFGNSIYELSDRVFKINHIKDLRKILYKNISREFKDDKQLYHFIHSFLLSTRNGYTLYFRNYKEIFGIDLNENAKIVSDEMDIYFKSQGL